MPLPLRHFLHPQVHRHLPVAPRLAQRLLTRLLALPQCLPTKLVANNTAWLLKYKLMEAMRKLGQRDRRIGTVQVDDAYLGGENPDGKCGRGWEIETPVLVELQVTDESQPVLLKLSVVGSFRKVGVGQWARENL